MQTQAIYDVYWPIILVSKDLNLRDHWMQSVNSYVPFCCGLTKVAEFLTHSLSWWQMSLSAVFAQVSVPLTQSAKGASHFLTYCSQCPCWPLCAQYLSKTKSTQQVDSDKKPKKAHWFCKVSEVATIISILFCFAMFALAFQTESISGLGD